MYLYIRLQWNDPLWRRDYDSTVMTINKKMMKKNKNKIIQLNVGYCFILWWTRFIWVLFHLISLKCILCSILLWLIRFYCVYDSAGMLIHAWITGVDWKRWMRLHMALYKTYICTMVHKADLTDAMLNISKNSHTHTHDEDNSAGFIYQSTEIECLCTGLAPIFPTLFKSLLRSYWLCLLLFSLSI